MHHILAVSEPWTSEPHETKKPKKDEQVRPAIPATPLSRERLYELLRRSEGLSREAAAMGRSLGLLSDSDLRIRLR
jgi:hypothetical protein